MGKHQENQVLRGARGPLNTSPDPPARQSSGRPWESLWERLEELWESSGRLYIYKNSRSTAPADVMLQTKQKSHKHVQTQLFGTGWPSRALRPPQNVKTGYQFWGTDLRIPRYHMTGRGMTLCKSRAQHATQRHCGPGSHTTPLRARR